jgi:hypothetical protein
MACLLLRYLLKGKRVVGRKERLLFGGGIRDRTRLTKVMDEDLENMLRIFGVFVAGEIVKEPCSVLCKMGEAFLTWRLKVRMSLWGEGSAVFERGWRRNTVQRLANTASGTGCSLYYVNF